MRCRANPSAALVCIFHIILHLQDKQGDRRSGLALHSAAGTTTAAVD
jgi:hypothetical protein